MIISASRRTDIPGYFSDWFIQRMKEREVSVRNPRFPKRINVFSLDPSHVQCIVFWTKHPGPMAGLAKTAEQLGYSLYVQCTLNAYGRDIEPGMEDHQRRLDELKRLSDQLSPRRVLWRYDPVVVTSRYSVDVHLESFSRTAEQLKGYVKHCVFSFVDIYKKIEKHVSPVPLEDMLALSEGFSRSAKSSGITASTCAEAIDLQHCGISHGSCIDASLIEEVTGTTPARGKDPSQRTNCGCIRSIDIGTYGTCRGGCIYCYAS